MKLAEVVSFTKGPTSSSFFLGYVGSIGGGHWSVVPSSMCEGDIEKHSSGGGSGNVGVGKRRKRRKGVEREGGKRVRKRTIRAAERWERWERVPSQFVILAATFG